MRSILKLIQVLFGGIIYLPHILVFLLQPDATKRFIVSDICAKSSNYPRDTHGIVGGVTC